MASPHSRAFASIAPNPAHAGLSKPLLLPRRTKQTSACTGCKARKTKCSGTHPCEKCILTGKECIFPAGMDRRRKYAQRRMEQELETVHRLLDLIVEVFEAGDSAQLRALISSAKEDRAREVALFDGRTPSIQEESGSQSQSQSQGSRSSSLLADESKDSVNALQKRRDSSSSSSTSIGSLNEVNRLTEDPNRNGESRATGYIGKESEIAWMQKLEAEASKLDKRDQRGRPPPAEEPIMSMSYHLDNLQIVNSLPDDPRLLPPKAWAARLMNIFFNSADHFFPLINRSLFISQFNRAFSQSAQQPTAKWLAVFNMALAIGAKYFQLAEPETGRDVDDRIFLSRAISLNKTHKSVIEHSDLHQVQIDLLLAIYYLISGQVNRSWQITGRATRSAISLGLNLCTVSDQIDPVSKETRIRMWWSIFAIEHILSCMTGRSPCVDHHSASASPPIPFCEAHFDQPEAKRLLSDTNLREEKLCWAIYASDADLESRNNWLRTIEPTPALFYFHFMDLFIITHAAVKTIYNLSKDRDTGQSGIPLYQKKLHTWLVHLQKPFAFIDYENGVEVARDCREQVSLAMAYYSAQIVLSRPCLTRPDVKEGTNIRFPRSRFGNDTAKMCVHSAVALISILPDVPDTRWLLRMTPWWCVLHFIMQAETILLIQLAIGQVPVEDGYGNKEERDQGEGEVDSYDKPEVVLEGAKKGARWLYAMAERDASAERAFRITDGLLRRIAAAKGLDLEGVPMLSDDGRQDSGQSSTDSHQWRVRRREDEVNWGPDGTIPEGGFGMHHDAAFTWDPIFFWTDSGRGARK
ncbi:fungal-specific transcription factor domain-containing protein [Aspergillus carlsbadensis]|nr:fungal-specific transcription factor domain-containing protein [Aspergillus carlsbadensis]